ncbi:MAG: AMP-binding protein [Selenomonadaceae bacterium]|nr:AMP-binding protein [Selenomonadaceae bacterium]
MKNNEFEFIHERIARYGLEMPTQIAAQDDIGDISYGELNAKCNFLANKLKNLGITENDVVAVYVPYTKDIAVSAVAVWKIGGVFMPLDDAYPVDRLEYMLENSEASALFTCRSLWEMKKLNFPNEKIIFLDDPAEEVEICVEVPKITKDSPAMLIYTSGTTGRPKGVIHKYGIFSHLTDWINDEVPVNSSIRTAILTRFTFMGTTIFLFGTLFNGGTTFFAPKSARMDIEYLHKFLRQKKITHAFMSSGLAIILAEDYDITGINIFAGGEKLRNFKAHSKNSYLWNTYGSTEVSAVFTSKIFGNENPIPIGTHKADTKSILVDENFNLVNEGETGELLISNDYMSTQYLKLPDMTAEKWIELNGRLWYRTGDRVKISSEGLYYCLGRIDNMVKLRGFRIETGEVETQISNAVKEMNRNDVKDIVVTLKTVNNVDYLVCYYESKSELDTKILTEKISKYLADYMIPEFWVMMSEMPRNTNGKILRKELPLPKRQTSQKNDSYSEVLVRIIWAVEDVIGNIDAAYPHDTFTSLGGNSLMAMKLSILLRSQGIKVSTAQILQLNELQKIADAAEIDYSKLWSEEKYSEIVKDFSSRGENIEKILPLTTEQDENFFRQILQPDQSGCREVYMIELDSVIDEKDLRQALDRVAIENEKIRAAVVFHHTPVIQQAVTNRKIPLKVINVDSIDYQQLKSFRRQLLNISVDPQKNSLLQVICVNSGEQSFIFLLAFCIIFNKSNLFKYCKDLLSALEEKYPSDLSIREWKEVFSEEIFELQPTSTENKTTFKQMANSKITVPPEIYIYSENINPQMVFVHTGNSSGEVYYRLADRIKKYISFAVIEPFNLYHPKEATYGIKNIAARYVQTLKRHQPKGPYIIGGWCYGGVVAHEMACQLEQAGDKVQHLFMLDSHAITDETIRELTTTMFGETNREYFETSPLFKDLRESGMLEAVVNNFFHVSQDMATHIPSYFHGSVTYFKPEEVPANQTEKSIAYWKKMMEFEAGGFENFCDRSKLKIIHTPHEHDLMMDDPSLDIIVPEIYRVTIGDKK